jgi:hypothetical protein
VDELNEFETTVRYIWSDVDVDCGYVKRISARHAQLRLRAMATTRGLKPKVRHLEQCQQFEVEFTVRSIGRPQAVAIEASSNLVLRSVQPWAKAEKVWRVETETRPVSLLAVMGDAL